MRVRNWLIVAGAIVALLLLAGRAASALVVDHAWYVALGAPAIFWEQFTDGLLLQGSAWVLGSLFAFINLQAVRRTILAVAVPSRVANLELTAMVPSRRLLSITLVIAAVVGLVLALPLTDWTLVAMARHGVPFNEIEGILDRDLGFYIYTLPLEETVYLWALATLMLTIAIVSLLYALTRSLRVDGRRIAASTHVRRHLSVLGALVLCVLAWSYRLDGFDLLRQGSGPDGMFLRLDHIVSLQVDRILVVTCAICAPIFLRAGWLGHVRSALVTLSFVLVAAIGGRLLLPITLLRSDLVGEPARRDVDYIATRTLFSRRAFDVDGVQHVGADTITSLRGIVRPRLSLLGLSTQVSLWDVAAIRGSLSTRGTSQRDAAPVGWTRTADGRLAVAVVREPSSTAATWTVSVADATGSELRDSIVPWGFGTESDDAFATTEPLVAPGLRGTRVVTDVPGVMGTPLRSLGIRVAYAWDARDPSLLNAKTAAGPAPRVIAYRDVRERVARLAPVLVLGDEVQPILHEETLLWAVHLYSASDRYPLSQHWLLAGGSRSYFRLAATALVDASTGRVRIIPVERPDPIARSWFGRIPALITLPRDLPPTLLDQLPPPSDGALAQLRTFAQYGSRLEGNVLRQLPDSLFVGASPPIHFVNVGVTVAPAWSVPLVDGNERIDGVVTAVGGAVRGVFWDSTLGPQRRWNVEVERLRSALDSARASMPDGSRREPKMRMGTVHVVPSANGPVLLQSLVATRADGASAIGRVAVMDGERLALAGTTAGAIGVLRGAAASAESSTAWPALSGGDRDASATRFYDAMRAALRQGDWKRFGANFDSLGLLLGRPRE